MDNKNKEENLSQHKCKFFFTETVQGIVHEFCKNSSMIENNKIKADDKLKCIGINCGKATFDK